MGLRLISDGSEAKTFPLVGETRPRRSFSSCYVMYLGTCVHFMFCFDIVFSSVLCANPDFLKVYYRVVNKAVVKSTPQNKHRL